jgi:hypothetical protein
MAAMQFVQCNIFAPSRVRHKKVKFEKARSNNALECMLGNPTLLMEKAYGALCRAAATGC